MQKSVILAKNVVNTYSNRTETIKAVHTNMQFIGKLPVNYW